MSTKYYYTPNRNKGGKGLLVTAIVLGALTLAGVGTLLGVQAKNVKQAVNENLGDAEKVTFTQIVKKKNYYIPSTETNKNVTLSNGVYTFDNSASTSQPIQDGNLTFFENEAHDLTGYGAYYVSFKVKSDKVPGSHWAVYAQDGGSALVTQKTLINATAELNVWKSASMFISVDMVLKYGNILPITCFPGDVFHATDFMVTKITGLGIYEVSEACGVFEKLTKGEYFEGDKSFTKAEIKKATADWEAEQKAIADSAAAASSKASA